MKKIFILIFCLLGCAFVNAQHKCGIVHGLQELQRSNPAQYTRAIEFESRVKTILNNPTQYDIPETTIIIPVVVHIVYKNSEENISDTLVWSQIQVLNEDFRRKNPDRVNTPDAFAIVAADANIEFRLATIDPNGNPTNGITRTLTTQPFFVNNGDNYIMFTDTGGTDAWDTEKYLNIWVCGDLYDVDNPTGSTVEMLGYATLPFRLSNPSADGVVINYKILGRKICIDLPEDDSLVCGYSTGGRTATHEVGHWLNLLHLWGDYEKDCEIDDEVEDTPNQHSSLWGSFVFPDTSDSCSPDYPGIMFMNYMGYAYDAYRNMFTQGQVDRMRMLFSCDTIVGLRRSMLEHAEALTVGCHHAYIDQVNYLSTDEVVNCDVEIVNSTVENSADLTVIATNSIRLGAGFHAKAGSSFHARIEPEIFNPTPSLVRTQNSYNTSNENEDITSEEEISTSNITTEIEIYPNPASDKITIKSNTEEYIKQITITDYFGLTVISTNTEFFFSSEINISGLINGIYSVRVITENNTVRTAMFIKK